MAQDFAKAFYKSATWRRCRRSFIAERTAVDGGVCQRCGRALGYIVHHREWLTPENLSDADVALNHNNLEYVCLICHNKIEQGEEDPRYRFTPDGQLEAYPPHSREAVPVGRDRTQPSV